MSWLPAASVEMTVTPKLGVRKMLWIGNGAANKFTTLIQISSCLFDLALSVTCENPNFSMRKARDRSTNKWSL